LFANKRTPKLLKPPQTPSCSFWYTCCKTKSYFDIQGTLTPLLGIGVCVSIQFGALEYAKRVFVQRNIDQRVSSAGPDGKVLTPLQLIASGAFAGVANGFVSGPVEHIRIRKSPPPPAPPPPIFFLQDYKRNHLIRDCIMGPGTRRARSGRNEALRVSSRAKLRHLGENHWGMRVTSSAMKPSCSEK
jgi:hypothetical protein